MNLTKLEGNPKTLVIPQFMDSVYWYSAPIVMSQENKPTKFYSLKVKSFYQRPNDRIYTKCSLDDNGYCDEIEWMGPIGGIDNDKPKIVLAYHHITLELDPPYRIIFTVPDSVDIYVGDFTVD